MGSLLRAVILALAATSATRAYATITIGSGSAINFADAAISLGCSDLVVSGQAGATSAAISAVANLNLVGGVFAPAAAEVSLGGNFFDAGTFTPGTSRVNIVDACGSGSSTLSGATGFYDLVVTTATGKQLILPAGLVQSVMHTLTLQGTAGNMLQVISSASGQQALLNVSAGAMQTIAYVNARDNQASGAAIAPGAAATYNSVDGGNLLNWFTGAAAATTAVAAPLLDKAGRAVLLAGLLAAAWAALLRRRGAHGKHE